MHSPLEVASHPLGKNVIFSHDSLGPIEKQSEARAEKSQKANQLPEDSVILHGWSVAKMKISKFWFWQFRSVKT